MMPVMSIKEKSVRQPDGVSLSRPKTVIVKPMNIVIHRAFAKSKSAVLTTLIAAVVKCVMLLLSGVLSKIAAVMTFSVGSDKYAFRMNASQVVAKMAIALCTGHVLMVNV
jgi:hypothetical protein